jgi:hypothetical protein
MTVPLSAVRRMRCRVRALALALAVPLATAGAPSAAAQGLPEYAPISPVFETRSGLYFQPYREPRPGRWSALASVDYASTIESNLRPDGSRFLLDSEMLRLGLTLSRDIGPRTFVVAEAQMGGAYAGFLDGFLDWYHGLLGIDMPERDDRPHDAFAYLFELPDRSAVAREPSSAYLGDLRLSVGRRHDHRFQSVLSVTLPTNTAPAAYGRGTVSVSALNTFRTPLAGERLLYEGSLGIGFTPAHGELADLQRELFVSVTNGLRLRLWGRQSLYANLFLATPTYHDTRLPALDRRELSLDFGWILATRSGEWRIGMTEDMEPTGPAVDLIFRFGRSF